MLRIVARCRENTSSIASEISPIVARARVAAIESSSKLPVPRAPSRRAARAAWAPASPGGRGGRRAEPREPSELLLANGGVVDVADVDVTFLGQSVLVDADDHLVAA